MVGTSPFHIMGITMLTGPVLVTIYLGLSVGSPIPIISMIRLTGSLSPDLLSMYPGLSVGDPAYSCNGYNHVDWAPVLETMYLVLSVGTCPIPNWPCWRGPCPLILQRLSRSVYGDLSYRPYDHVDWVPAPWSSKDVSWSVCGDLSYSCMPMLTGSLSPDPLKMYPGLSVVTYPIPVCLCWLGPCRLILWRCILVCLWGPILFRYGYVDWVPVPWSSEGVSWSVCGDLSYSCMAMLTGSLSPDPVLLYLMDLCYKPPVPVLASEIRPLSCSSILPLFMYVVFLGLSGAKYTIHHLLSETNSNISIFNLLGARVSFSG